MTGESGDITNHEYCSILPICVLDHEINQTPIAFREHQEQSVVKVV